MIVYLAGPMTGYRNFNRDAFHAAEQSLNQRFPHLKIVNPAALDEHDPRVLTHAEYMRRDLSHLINADAIYLLPGWYASKGASLEATVAKGIGLLELHDPDVDLWRTFEGEPECGDVQHVAKIGETCTCIKAEGHGMPHDDGDGCWWEPPAEDLPVQTPQSAGRPQVGAEDLSDHPQWGDLNLVVDDTLPPNTLRIDHGSGHIDFDVSWRDQQMFLAPKSDAEAADPLADYRHADIDKPRAGDEFPDVGYVRRFQALLGLPRESYLDYGNRRSA